MKFGESESSLVDPDKSLVELMSITETKWHRCKMKLHGLNIDVGPVTTFNCFKIVEVKHKCHVICFCWLVSLLD